MISLVRKLSNKSWAEIADRSRQYFSRKLETIGLSSHSRPLDIRKVFGNYSSGRELDADVLLKHFRTRSIPFYQSFDSPRETVSLLKHRFPQHVSEVIASADRIIDGHFDLLGHKDLFFRRILPDWHFEPISGKTSPRVHWSRIEEIDAAMTGDKKVIWELNRHQYFTTLGQAYWITGDERYAETFASHLGDWFENNPPKIGVNWLSSLEVAFRTISWVWAFHFFKDSPCLTGGLLMKVLTFMHLNGRHLETYLSTYFSPNTHLTGEALGLYFLGSFLPEFPEADRWKRIGYKILLGTLDIHVAEDGVYCEQSSHYHRYTTDFYSNLLILRKIQKEDITFEHQEKLQRLFDHLLHISQPNGRTPLFGDDDGGRFLFLDFLPIDDFRPTLALGATLLGRGDLKHAAGNASPELLWLLGPDGLKRFDSVLQTEPAKTSCAFYTGGIFTARSSWTSDSHQIMIHCGPHGFLNGGHAHADALNVLVSLGGRPLFIDSGTFNYTLDLNARNRFRSTEAHNCLMVTGQGSSVPAGPFSWKSTTNCRLIKWSDDGDRVRFLGEHDGFKEYGVDYVRRVEFSRQGIVQITELISSSKENSFELNFILAPQLRAIAQLNSVVILEDGRAIAKMETTVSKKGRVEWILEDWLVSFRYGAILPTKRLKLAITGSGEISISNMLKYL